MGMIAILKSWSARARHTGTRQEGSLKAVRMLGAEGLVDARRRAGQALERAWRCTCCRSLLAHVFERVGSTLFLDDDPEVLVQAFEDSERDRFSARVLAACIVMVGRERVAVAL
ncbi:hypothetical protein D7Y13_24885 [Corallococcus praedator]|uniref:Uncharacterized protein n=2 Tax=Corallococcus praedator TaxID=2316724 RepID=A0ABX9QDU2_9BACT|nr:hypothetical protein [Corallococcus sp. CA031C]RKH27356.1 hypothetical protein D7X75_26640 [Corallococcus sp. CA031C]RKI02339.1 hypothetical protein D7Y13_24885 [Corallococcus praedator]